MHPRAFQLLRGVSMQPFFAEPDDQGGGAPADPPPADPPADPVDPPADPDPVDPPAGDPPAPPADPAPPEAPKRADWRQGRMDTLTARAKAAEEREAAAAERARVAEERASAYEALYGKPEGDPTPAPAPATGVRVNDKGERLYTQAELDALSKANAATARLNEKLDAMFDEGSKAHGNDFVTRVNEAGSAFKDELQKRPDFWDAVSRLPNGADVYHALAGDLNHLAEVLAMQPVDLGMELARLSTTASAKPKAAAVSKVPAPITPIDTVHEGEVDLSKADMQTYAKEREAQRQARYDAKYG